VFINEYSLKFLFFGLVSAITPPASALPELLKTGFVRAGAVFFSRDGIPSQSH
jgi:hypothetical protein